MTDDRSFERRMVTWLEEEATGSLSDRVLESVFAETRVARRPARPFAGRFPTVPRIAVALMAVGTTAIVLMLGVALLGRPSARVGGPPASTAPLSSNQAASSTSPSGPLVPQARIPVSNDGGIVFAFDSLWIGDQNGVQRIDPATNASTLIPTTGPAGVSADSTAVYADTSAGKLRIDPSSNQTTAIKAIPGMPAYGSSWDMGMDGTLHRYNATTGVETGHVSVQGPVGSWPNSTSGFGSIWIASGDTHTLIRLNPTSLKITATVGGMSTADSLWSVGIAFGSVWVQANDAPPTGVLYRVDPATNTVIATIPVGDSVHTGQYGGTNLAFSTDSVWTADSGGTVSRVDASANRLLSARLIDLSSPESIAFGANSVWVRNQSTSVVERLDAAAWPP